MSKHLSQLKLQLVLVSVVWFLIVQIPDRALYTKESPEVQARMEAECTGSYQQRYDCKNMIAIEVSNYTLMQVTIRIILWVFGPCGAYAYYTMVKRREPPPPPPPVVHDDMSWKSAAKSHVTNPKVRPPDEPFSLDKL